MANARTLLREARRLEAGRMSLRKDIPTDPVEFARSVGLEPDTWQRDVLVSEAPRILLNVSRQAGKSTVAAVVGLHRALIMPGSLILILAPSERQAKETFSKAAGAYRDLGYPIAPDSDRKLGMELKNGSRIEALPAAERTVRGFSGVDLLLLDEAARVPDELFYSVKPMLSVSGGRMVMMSTPAGRRGVFYHEWSEGEGWERHEIPATECPRISPEFLEAERKAMPSFWYEQEYLVRFLDTEDQYFSSDLINSAITPDVTPLFEEAG